jgi:hypothetical protein
MTLQRNPLYYDEDGYPTYDACEKIACWDYKDPAGWFEFIFTIWHLRAHGWHSEPCVTDHWSGWKLGGTRYHLSTVGWSGNEMLIKMMQKNEMLWDETWQQSQRGGHHTFEVALEEIPDEKENENG